MGTIHQPTPSNPKSPQHDAPPLQPGRTVTSNPNDTTPERPNPQSPDTQREKSGQR